MALVQAHSVVTAQHQVNSISILRTGTSLLVRSIFFRVRLVSETIIRRQHSDFLIGDIHPKYSVKIS